MNRLAHVMRAFRALSLRRKAAWSALVIGLMLLVGGFAWYHWALGPASAADTSFKAFTVKPGQNAQAIATDLADAGLVRSRNGFITYLNFKGLRASLKAGTYSLSASQTAPAIAAALTDGKALTDRMTVPEGYRIAQIETLAERYGISKEDFETALAAPHPQSFLKSKPAGVSLEGYLFPDSYEVTDATTATSLVDAMLNTFGQRVGAEYEAAFAAQGLTLHQGLTLASIVEREVNIEADRPVVAQVFLTRLKKGETLGSDVTTHYAADLLGVPFDVNLNSPYNTRRVTGLPPGPISNPGLSALDAVARPATTDYEYFLSGTDGKTYFAKTYAEHQRNIQLHLQ